MWARNIELMLGVWLVISPFVFLHADDALRLWITDLATGAAVIVVGLLLVLFGIVPSRASTLPRRWRDFYTSGQHRPEAGQP